MMITEELPKSILASIKQARIEFPTIRFAGFHNLWQVANELKNLNTIQKAAEYLEQQGQTGLLKILQTLISTPTPLQCPVPITQPRQIQFSSQFALIQQVIEFYNQGFVVICDDLNLWKQIHYAVSDHQINIAADWISKFYTYTTTKKLINTIEMLRHPLLKNVDEHFHKCVMHWEYTLRKNQQQSLEGAFPDHPLCQTLLNTTFKEVFDHLPPSAQQQVLPLTEYITLLDGTDHCLEWFKGAITLSTCPSQLRLGVHSALEFKPNQVIFCLKHNQFRPLQSQFLFKKKMDKNLTELLLAWKGTSHLNILGHTQNIIFYHPLVQDERLEQHQVKRLTTVDAKPIANPNVNSRPTTISATGFNQLMQDPYGFYARYILKLRHLERIHPQLLQQEFGLIVHKILEIYIKQGFENALKYFYSLILGRHTILWKGRILRILHWVHAQMNDLKPVKIEGEKDFQSSVGPITLKARIDACVFTPQGNLVINFKTGNPPSKIDVTNGYAPQLAIEMFLASKESPNISTQAEFWQLKGTKPIGNILSNIAIPTDLLQKEFEKITLHYLTKNTPFLTCPWPSKTPKYNEYKHLERIT